MTTPALRSAGLLITALALAGVAGCGDDPAAAAKSRSAAPSAAATASPLPSRAGPTKAEFLARGDAVCAARAKAMLAVPSANSEDEFGAVITKLAAVEKAAGADLRGLGPPPDGVAVLRALVVAQDRATTTTVGAATAARSGDTVTAGDLLREADEERSSPYRTATTYGFKVCAKPVEQ